ncbi:MAG: hypothetical protein QUS07_10355 [Methanothrix sp.]|nr:hypothetical protein [Methanothrix sp.]
MNIDGDLALIDAVRHICKASGYRSADICWLLQWQSVACPP